MSKVVLMKLVPLADVTPEQMVDIASEQWALSVPHLAEQKLEAAWFFAREIRTRPQVIHLHSHGQDCVPQCVWVAPAETAQDVVEV